MELAEYCTASSREVGQASRLFNGFKMALALFLTPVLTPGEFELFRAAGCVE